jgi:hypothetical protein
LNAIGRGSTPSIQHLTPSSEESDMSLCDTQKQCKSFGVPPSGGTTRFPNRSA